MRTSSRAAACLIGLLATGCGQQAAGDPFAADGAAAETIECALAGQTEFARSCSIERAPGADGLLLTIRHPDGGFRRLQVTQDGRVVSVVGGDGIEVAVGGERYRLPATVKSPDASAR
jgi:hypothetical protein